MNIFADSGVWQALYDTDDKYHTEAAKAFRGLAGQKATLYITDYIFDEAITLILGRAGHYYARVCGDWLLNSPRVRFIRINIEQWDEAWALFQRYDDKKFSFTDCTSFVTLRQQGLHDVFGFDRHFEQMGFRLWPR
ncbi:MAG: type II toxin-antitoxin system VapC family toxin [Anaerolineales bacterium]